MGGPGTNGRMLMDMRDNLASLVHTLNGCGEIEAATAVQAAALTVQDALDAICEVGHDEYMFRGRND